MIHKLRTTLGILSLLLVFSNIIISQTVPLIPYRIGKKWGYSDINKNIIIPCKYNQTLMFRGNYAKVQKGKKWGLINKNGEEVISCKYKTIKKISSDLYLTYNKNTQSIFNVKDSILIIDNISTIKINHCGNINYCCNDSFGIIDTLGNTISEAIFKKIGFFQDGYTIATTFSGENYLLNCSGHKRLIPSNYTNPGEVRNGRIVYCLNHFHFGVIDTLGNEIIPPTYTYIYPFRAEISVLKSTNLKYGLVNNTGEILTPIEYDGFKNDYSFDYIFLKKDSLFGFIDATGKTLIPFKYKDIIDYNDGRAIVSDGNKLGVVDTLGQIFLAFEYDRIYEMNNKYRITKNNKSGIANLSGIIIIPCEYELIGKYADGIAYARKEGKCGYIDSIGNHIVPFEFENITAPFNNTFWTRLDNNWILVDFDFNQISENSYDDIFAYKLNYTGYPRIIEGLEDDGLTMTEVQKKVFFARKVNHCSRKKSFFIRKIVSTKYFLNGYVSRLGVEYFED
jgi:hypothetical protein